jgi:hypothetical protein
LTHPFRGQKKECPQALDKSVEESGVGWRKCGKAMIRRFFTVRTHQEQYYPDPNHQQHQISPFEKILSAMSANYYSMAKQKHQSSATTILMQMYTVEEFVL